MKTPFRVRSILLLLALGSSLHAYDRITYMVPMRDSVRLATDVAVPEGNAVPRPAILIRTPYGRKSVMEPLLLFILVDLKGYALVSQDLRGRGESEGLDSLFFSDGWGRVRDGYDAVEWTAGQPWCNGKVGTWGYSGLGIPEYLAAGTTPPHLLCCFVMVAASNLYEDAIFYGGAYQRALVDGWLSEVHNPELASFFIQHPNQDPSYDPVNLSARWDSVNVPILHMTGWHDIFVQGVINAFEGIQNRGGQGARGRQKLIVGPWEHNITQASTGQLTFPNSSFTAFFDLQVEWFDCWLKNVDNGADRIPAVQYYTMGDADRTDGPGNSWIRRDDWPPPARDLPLYLASGGRLTSEPPPVNDPPDFFEYDPEKPVPTVGGRNLNLRAGSYDQRSVESRSDVLVYTTPPLTDSLSVAGRVRAVLWAATDGIDTDFTAKLCDVYPDGRSMLIADGIVQARHRNTLKREEFLVPDQAYEFSVDLWSTAVTFVPGHSIRLDISSSNANRFEPNPNTGEPFRLNTGFRTAHQTVYHDAGLASALRLPVVGGSLSAVQIADAFLPQSVRLERNFPNPFNAETLIPVDMPAGWGERSGSAIRIEIADVTGRRIRQWILGTSGQGRILLRWRGDDESGNLMPSGVYLCRLTAGSVFQTQKITLMR